MLTSAALLSRLKDEVDELIPECAIHVVYPGRVDTVTEFGGFMADGHGFTKRRRVYPL